MIFNWPQGSHRESESVSGGDCFFRICWLPGDAWSLPQIPGLAHLQPGISWGKEENEIAKSLRNGWWVWQKCWLSSDTKSIFSKHNCFTAFCIFFVVFFFILPLYFLWWCFSKWSSFWKLLRYVSAVLKGNRKKGFFSTWIWMLKVQEHEGSGWVGALRAGSKLSGSLGKRQDGFEQLFLLAQHLLPALFSWRVWILFSYQWESPYFWVHHWLLVIHL